VPEARQCFREEQTFGLVRDVPGKLWRAAATATVREAAGTHRSSVIVRAYAAASQQLADLHLRYEQVEPFWLEFVTTPGEPLSYRVEKMALSMDKTRLVVNDSLDSGRHPEGGVRLPAGQPVGSIVRLVGQVVRVSVEAVKIVAGLPAEYSS
jgi:predicted helicase